TPMATSHGSPATNPALIERRGFTAMASALRVHESAVRSGWRPGSPVAGTTWRVTRWAPRSREDEQHHEHCAGQEADAREGREDPAERQGPTAPDRDLVGTPSRIRDGTQYRGDDAEPHREHRDRQGGTELWRELVQQHAAGEEGERGADPREERALVREREAIVGLRALMTPRRFRHPLALHRPRLVRGGRRLDLAVVARPQGVEHARLVDALVR